MSDITYIIGAEDRASKKLDGVGATMGRLEKSSKDFGDTAQRSLGKVEVGIDGLLKASGVLFVIDKAVQAITASLSFFGDGLDGARNAAASVDALASAMNAAGGASQEMIDANVALTDSLETMTGVEAESIQGLMTMAANLGAPTDKLDDLAQASLGLSEAMGVSLESALTMVRKAQEGNFAAFEKRLPQLKNLTSDEEKLAAVMELASRGVDQASEKYQGAGGAMARMAKAADDFAELIMSAVLPVVDSAINGFAAVATTLSDVLMGAFEASGSGIKSFQEFASAAITAAANSIISAITMAEVIVMNFGDVWQIVRDSILLRVESITADLSHFFGTVLPAYGSWLVENFPKFFIDAFNAITTVISNGAEIAAAGFAALWDFIKSGGGSPADLAASLGEAMSGSLLEGFEATVTELPTILERSITDREQELAANIGATAGKLADEFASKFESRKIGGKKLAEGVASSVELELTKGIEAATEKAADKLNTEGSLANALTGGKSGSGGGLTGDLNAVSGRLITRGTGQNPMELWRGIAKDIAELKKSAANSEHANLAAASAAAELANMQRDKPVIELAPVGP